MFNCEVLFREDCTTDEFIDVIVGNRVYMPCIYVSQCLIFLPIFVRMFDAVSHNHLKLSKLLSKCQTAHHLCELVSRCTIKLTKFLWRKLTDWLANHTALSSGWFFSSFLINPLPEEHWRHWIINILCMLRCLFCDGSIAIAAGNSENIFNGHYNVTSFRLIYLVFGICYCLMCCVLWRVSCNMFDVSRVVTCQL